MSTITAQSRSTAAGRHLDLKRPPRYGPVRASLHAGLEQLRVYDLWERIFGLDCTQDSDWLDLQIGFIVRVRDELFPLGQIEEEADFVFYGFTSLLEIPVPVMGWRLPYEAAHCIDLPAWQQAAVATLSWNCLQDDGDWFQDRVAAPYDVWWLVPWATVEAWRIGLSWLAHQAPHWAGLANLIWISLRDYANPFLGLPGDLWAAEYAVDVWYWTVEDITWLAKQWQQARPVVERIERFARWFNAQPDQLEAHLQVIDILGRSSDATAP